MPVWDDAAAQQSAEEDWNPNPIPNPNSNPNPTPMLTLTLTLTLTPTRSAEEDWGAEAGGSQNYIERRSFLDSLNPDPSPSPSPSPRPRPSPNPHSHPHPHPHPNQVLSRLTLSAGRGLGWRHVTPTAYCLQPTAYCLLPTTYCLQPTTYSYYLLPTTYLPATVQAGRPKSMPTSSRAYSGK
eukprot:scaffold21183_cov36-Phaeocystis_antarctica.AAC.1